MKDQQVILERFRRGLQGGSQKYTEGVQSPKRPWKESASSDQAEKRYAAGVTRAASQKSRQKAVASMSEEDWRTAAVQVGAANLAAASERAATNYAKNLPTIMSAASAATAAAMQIDGTTMESRLQRAAAAARAIHRAWATKKGIQPEV